MLKKEVLIIFLFLVVISGCQTGATSNNQIGDVEINFLENMPPETLRENQAFRVGLSIQNNMLQDINYDLCVYDTPSSRFGGINNQECIRSSIAAAIESGNEVIPTISDQIIFPQKGDPYIYKNLDFGVSTSNIVAELTYDVSPVTKAEVCLAKDVNIQTADGVNCDLTQKISGSKISYEGGPIKISNVDVDISPQGNNKISVFLNVEVQKIGNGVISYLEKGDNGVGLQVSLSGVNFNCAGLEGGVLKLTETNKKVTCKGIIDMGGNNYYTDTILIKTTYTNTISKTSQNIELKKEDEI